MPDHGSRHRSQHQSSTQRSAYEVLGVPFDADEAALKAAWRKAARRTHPDHGGDPAEFRAVSDAWQLVSTPEARRAYDRSFASASHRGPASGSAASNPFTPGPTSTAGSSGVRSETRRPRQRWSPTSGPSSQRNGASSPAVTYHPPLSEDGPLDAERSSQQIHGAPRKRGILPAGARLVREARTIRVLQNQVLNALPAARLISGLSLSAGRVSSGAIDHVVLCGDRLAVVGSLQVPDGVYRWDGAELWKGDRPVSPPSLAPAMVALQRAFPECTVGGFVLVLASEDNPHAPIIELDRTRSLETDAAFLTDPPANALQLGRDLKMFLGTGSQAHTVDRRVLARLLGAMY
ncbi:J domain-containing protein [Micrococcus terreus]|uniref:J domain-containing protein n=1 Tax=Micrococcus terreus TaxID=574650 RepID=UPI0025517BD2|nr:J domain-containing protein [Micrococcus terreus]MDK7701163.1 J domain-containing protein [Micrococcus terreus]WOO98651.1 J domain-containing protein [Micrococcus terreus]